MRQMLYSLLAYDKTHRLFDDDLADYGGGWVYDNNLCLDYLRPTEFYQKRDAGLWVGTHPFAFQASISDIVIFYSHFLSITNELTSRIS